MTPNHQLVAELGATGRHLIALGLLVLVAVLALVAWYLGRNQSSRDVRRGASSALSDANVSRTVGLPSGKAPKAGQAPRDEATL